MRYFSELSEDLNSRIFYKKPKTIQIKDLSYALGALLYIPATMSKRIFDKLIENEYSHIKSCVFCLEDSIIDSDIACAEKKLVEAFEYLDAKMNTGYDIQIPLIFIRVRNFMQMNLFGDNIKYITGFIFPKFKHIDLEYMATLEMLNDKHQNKIYFMPILESSVLLHRDRRLDELYNLKKLFIKYRDYILNIRIGGTDLSGLCGVRRTVDITIYDLLIIRDIISDVVGIFCNKDDNFIVSAPVWEYYAKNYEFLSSNFELNLNIKGLIKEAMLDKQNGFIGKTCIHPSQLLPVQFTYSVGLNEYNDALQIINMDGGVFGSLSNRMNEVKPHAYWAHKIIKRADIYGVLNYPECNYHAVRDILKLIFAEK